MEEKERIERIGSLKEQLAKEQNNLQKFQNIMNQAQQAVNQTQANIIALAARLDELENERWKNRESNDGRLPNTDTGKPGTPNDEGNKGRRSIPSP